MRTTISIPEPLLETTKRRAAARGVTVSVVIEDALRSHLAASKTTPAPPFRLHTVRGKLVNPDLDLDRTSALIAMDDEAAYGRG
jgi:hypothetical protein